MIADATATSTYVHPAVVNNGNALCTVSYSATYLGVAISAIDATALFQYNTATRTFTFSANYLAMGTTYPFFLTATDGTNTLAFPMTLVVENACTGATLEIFGSIVTSHELAVSNDEDLYASSTYTHPVWVSNVATCDVSYEAHIVSASPNSTS